MGIKNLHKFLKKHAEDAYEVTHLSNFEYKKIAIDTSLYMYKYKVIFADINPETGKKISNDIKGKSGKSFFVETDVSNEIQ